MVYLELSALSQPVLRGEGPEGRQRAADHLPRYAVGQAHIALQSEIIAGYEQQLVGALYLLALLAALILILL